MELTKKQIILVAAISGAILLLTVAAILIFTPGDGEAAPEPTASPTATAPPTATPAPTDTPRPTDYRLPLVPQWDTPRPSADPTGAFAPQTQTVWPEGTAGPWVDAGEDHAQDILAVGLREGRAAALLLLRFGKDGLTMAALPADETPLAGEEIRAQGAGAAALAESLTGRPWGAWLALDLTCLPAVLSVTGPLGEEGAESLSPRGVLSLAMGAAAYVQRVSLLKLPALKRAVGNSFASNLTTWELWKLFWTVRGGVAVRTEPDVPKIF